MAARKAPNMTEKLASALLEMQRLRGDPIPREHAKQMHAEQICSLFQFDHDAGFVCHGAGNHPTEMTPKLRLEHKEKTRKDQGIIAKCEVISAEHEAFRARMLAKITGTDAEGIEKAARRATLRSAGFDKTRRRTMAGKVLPR
jgi:hypothetical protein